MKAKQFSIFVPENLSFKIDTNLQHLNSTPPYNKFHNIIKYAIQMCTCVNRLLGYTREPVMASHAPTVYMFRSKHVLT